MLELGEAFERAFGFIPSRTNNLIPLALPLPSHQRFKRDLALINDFIDERIAAGRRNGGEQNLLTILLKARDEETGRGMTAEQLRDEVVTLFFAGFETTARTLTWGWYLLARHPEAMAKLQAEADRVLGERTPGLDDLDRLTYTRMVTDEVLRIYPPTALLARENLEDDEIGGYRIPAGSMVILVPYQVHRDPDLWPDPERFDPERFSAEQSAERPKTAYIPFAAGQRICVGNNFALMEMVYAYAMIARRYHMEMVAKEEIPFIFAGTMRPKAPLRMRLHQR
jgi:cytochrome P450